MISFLKELESRNELLYWAGWVFLGGSLLCLLMMLISDQGTLVRCRTDEISVLGRNTQGVRVIRLKAGESLVNAARIEEPEDEAEAVEDDSPSE